MAPPENPTIPLHHPTMPTLQTQPPRARRYARRVQESLTSRFARLICSIFLFLLLIAGLILFILWLSLRPHRPRFFLESFTLNQSGSAISFNVTDRNPNQNIGIYYEDMNGSVYYFDQRIASGPVMSAFYQPPKNTTLIQGQLGSVAGGPPLSQITGNQSTALRFELSSTIQFKVRTWDTHHHRMHVSCDLAVGADGNLLPQYVNERCSIYFWGGIDTVWFGVCLICLVMICLLVWLSWVFSSAFVLCCEIISYQFFLF